MTDMDNDAAVVRGLTAASLEIKTSGDHPFVVIPNDMRVHSLEDFESAPFRIKRTVAVERVSTFNELTNRFKGDSTSLYVATNNFLGVITAVIDDDQKDDPAWRQHKIDFTPEQHPAFGKWWEKAGCMMTLRNFANFLEQQRSTIITPEAATLVSTIRDLKAMAKVEIHEAVDEFTGSRTQSYAQAVTLKGAKGQDTTLPATFTVRVPLYRGQDSVLDLTCLIRTSVDDGTVKMGFVIDLIDETLEAVQEQMVTDIAEATGLLPLYAS